MNEIKILTFTVAVVVVALLAKPSYAQDPSCPKKIDIVFLYEVPNNQLVSKTIKDLKEVLIELNRGRTSTDCFQLSLVVVGKNIVEYVQPLGCGERCTNSSIGKLDDIERRIANVRARSNQDVIVRALKGLEAEVYSAAKGGRDDASKSLVLMFTYPEADSVQDIVNEEVDKLRTDRGYDIIAMGIGKLKRKGLIALAGNQENRVITLRDIRELLPSKPGYGILSQLLLDPDYDRFHLDNLPQPDKGCEFIADIAFLVDSSGSIRLDYLSEIQFLQRIVSSFGISVEGTHAGVVVFSAGGRYTNLAIRFDQYTDTQKFLHAAEDLPFYNSVTRIDLAFKVANEQLFNSQYGARDNVEKILFLLTDGNQNPKKDRVTGEVLDPVKTSQPLIDRGIKIFAIGIGNDLDRRQLIAMTRNADRVKTVENAADLTTSDFIKSIASQTCKEVVTKPPPTTTTTTITTPSTTPCKTEPTPCPGVGSCDTCCQPRNTYLNIFQPGTGPHYLMQGMTVTQKNNKGPFHGVQLPQLKPNVDISGKSGRVMSTEEIIDLLKSEIGNNQDLFDKLRAALSGKTRARRSIDGEGLIKLMTMAKAAGCSKFLQDLQENFLWNTVMKMIEGKQPLTIFCPIDEKYEDLLDSKEFSPQDIKNTLIHHITTRFGKQGMTYRSLLNDEKMTISKSGKEENFFKIKDTNVKVSLSFGSRFSLVVIDNVLEPVKLSMMHVLKNTQNVSIMTNLIQKGALKKLLHRVRQVENVCFAGDICMPVGGNLKKHFNNLLRVKQFTIQVLNDEIFASMDRMKLNLLLRNKDARKEFLLKHVFLGILDHNNMPTTTKLIASPAKKDHPVTEMSWNKGKAVVVHPDDSVYVVEKVIRVKEGLVQIMRRMN